MSGERVLVVEDDQDLRELVVMLLESESYMVSTAINGEAALEEVANTPPDLILLDMRMPVMDGWGFSRELRKRYAHPPPVIVITAAEDARLHARDVGAQDCLAKPFTPDDLLAGVARNLEPSTRDELRQTT